MVVKHNAIDVSTFAQLSQGIFVKFTENKLISNNDTIQSQLFCIFLDTFVLS